MSRPADKRSSILQTLMMMVVVFMGFQLFQTATGGTANKDPRKADEIWKGMVAMNAEALDVKITAELPHFEQKFKEEASVQKLPPDQVSARLLKARVLVADTKVKSAHQHPGFAHAKLSRAYDLLKQNYDGDKDTPAWTEKVAVAPDAKAPESEVSAAQTYELVVASLSAQNKKEMVWGMVPGFQFIDFLVGLTGHVPGFSYAFAALILAVCVRAAVWPLTQKQYLWGRKMQQLQPMLKEIEAKYKDKKTGLVTDQAAYQQEAMKLYGEYGMNPFSGCGPALIQIPFFFMIFTCMQMYRFEFTKGTFLWINPSATKFLGIPVAPNLGEKDYILVFIYGVTMVITTFMTPVSDPTQQKQQRIMGLVFAVGIAVSMFWYPLASAFILYWIFTNILATGQSLMVNRMTLPPLVKVATPHGGAFPFLNQGAAAGATSEGQAVVSPDFFSKTGSKKANKPKQPKAKVKARQADSPSEPEPKAGLLGWLRGQNGPEAEKKGE